MFYFYPSYFYDLYAFYVLGKKVKHITIHIYVSKIPVCGLKSSIIIVDAIYQLLQSCHFYTILENK